MKKILLSLIIFQFFGFITDITSQKLVVARCIPEVNIVVNNGVTTIKAIDFDNSSFAYDTLAKRYTFSNIKPVNDSDFDETKTKQLTSMFGTRKIITTTVRVWYIISIRGIQGTYMVE